MNQLDKYITIGITSFNDASESLGYDLKSLNIHEDFNNNSPRLANTIGIKTNSIIFL